MKKISTLYKKNPDNLALVTSEIDPGNQWVFTDEGVKATRKYDGTACAIIDGLLYKRYDVKKGKAIPVSAIACQEADLITGHHPHWVLCTPENPADKYHLLAYNNTLPDGTYELCGEKVQGNPESITGHQLIPHGKHILHGIMGPWSFENFREYLLSVDIEGIVFHHPDGRMCKLRKSDFGFKRTKI